ncbi:energy transducer TonB family protein [Dysgonomonas massiliensis]|uniref:energy transducer TonB family protein n=1 Tax=Dysgonomonas massiliensis TaxID=2040292 RepID=UPI000C77732A|nr:energy transducer TonB [Dysgonomonas massiliensis]
MKKILVTCLLTLSFSLSYATKQMGDWLIYKGDTLTVYYFILDDYLWESPAKDTFYEKNKDLLMGTTACWRGYRAVMEIRNDSLFLKKVCGRDNLEMDISPLFDQEKDIFVYWYTGSLTNLRNNQIYVHEDWGGFYEYETDFIFKKGILKNIEEYHNTIKTSIYANTDNWKILVDYVQSSINYDNVKPVGTKIRIITRINDVDENGIITDVSILKGYNDEYDREAIRVIKSIPQWQVIIRRGKKVNIPWTIPVIFEAKD